jgi:hypothetical protein
MSSVTRSGPGSWFVYRSLYEGMAGKRVRRLPDTTVLAWFQRMWAATAGVVDIDTDDQWAWAEARIAAELGGEVYGLSSVFVTARERGLVMPTSWQELRELLQQALYVEHEVRVDAHSVRASTDDDTIYLAYYFFDDTLADTRADRVAWLLYDSWELPESVGPGAPFQPGVPVRPLLPSTAGEGATYVVLPVDDDVLWYQRSRPWVVPGVRLPELAGWLRSIVPEVTEVNQPGLLDPHRLVGWPEALLLLRALVTPGEAQLALALERCNYWPDYFSWEDDYIGPERRWLLEAHGPVHAHAMDRLRQDGPLWWQDRGRDPSASRIQEREHLAQLAMHVTQYLGYRSWVLFDDLWAAAHPDLALGILRAASGWDPFAP